VLVERERDASATEWISMMLDRKKREGYGVLLAAAWANSAVALAKSAVASSSVGVFSVGFCCVGSSALSSG
jgi:hypothetical protein